MTTLRVAFVDCYVFRGAGERLECLLLKRAPGGRSPGTWEAVHGHIEAGETPAAAAQRELAEETGLTATRLYNLSRVETFYRHRADELAFVPVFVAFVAPGATVRLSPEHDDCAWVLPDDAMTRVTWPREARAIEDARRLFGSGDAGAAEDVLRVC